MIILKHNIKGTINDKLLDCFVQISNSNLLVYLKILSEMGTWKHLLFTLTAIIGKLLCMKIFMCSICV